MDRGLIKSEALVPQYPQAPYRINAAKEGKYQALKFIILSYQAICLRFAQDNCSLVKIILFITKFYLLS